MSAGGGGDAGRLLRAHRAAAGLTQQRLAALAGVSLRTVRDIEQGRVLRPHPRSLRRLRDVLALTPAEWGELAAAVDAGAGPGGGARLWVGVLGPLALRHRGVDVPVSSPKLRRLLGLLALHAPHPVGIEEIVSVLWDAEPPPTRLDLVKGYATRLRALLEPDLGAAPVLLRSGGGYALTCTARQCDVRRFEDLAGQAERSGGHADPATATRLWEEALRCWRGPLLPDLDPVVREHPAALALRRRHRDGVLVYADLRAAAGEHRLAVAALHELAAAEPLHEGLHARLMRALAGSGEQAAAFGTYAEIRARLADQLGVEPGPELRAAQHALLHPPDGRPDRVGTGRPEPSSQPTPHPVPAQLPPALHTLAGRREQLRQLSALLPRPGRSGPGLLAAISGTAGVGKTTLAIHWAHRNAHRFPAGQLYVDLRGYDPGGRALRADEAVRGFLDALGVPARDIPTGVDAQAGLYRSLVAGQRILVVLDNARDADQVRPLLPGHPAAATLVTSRNPLTGLIGSDGAQPVPLDLLTPAEAADLLARRLGAARTDAEPAAVARIVAACARLPLALTVVAARAALNPGFALAALAAELTGAPGAEVRTVLSWSYATLSAPAASLFRLLGLHPGPDVSAAAAASVAGERPAAVRRLLAELTAANLLTEHAPGRYGGHDLLRAYAADLAAEHDPGTDRAAATRRLLDHYLHTGYEAARLLQQRDEITLPLAAAAPGVTVEPLADYPTALAWLAAEHRVLLGCLHLAGGAGPGVGPPHAQPPDAQPPDAQPPDAETAGGRPAVAWQLVWALDTYLDRTGRWPALLACWQLALTAAERLGDVPAQAHALRRIGRMHTLLKQDREAEAALLRAVGQLAEIGDQTGEARTHMQLGFVWTERGRPDVGLEYVHRALALCRIIGSARGEAHALNNAGWCQALLGNHRQALTDCAAALAIHRRDGDRWGEAGALDSLGYAHHHLGEHADALRHYQTALALYEELGSRFDAAQTLDHLGDTHAAAGRPAAARAAWRRALSTLDTLRHPDAAAVRAKLPAQPPPDQPLSDQPLSDQPPSDQDSSASLPLR
jgi:DNA-binding SARP family transcriptional activator/tetratricopeptide (TPR) repeat protein